MDDGNALLLLILFILQPFLPFLSTLSISCVPFLRSEGVRLACVQGASSFLSWFDPALLQVVERLREFMALAHRRNVWHEHTRFPFDDLSIALPNKIIKSYLPRLWKYTGVRARAEGFLDLEGRGIVQGRYSHAALAVILRALKFSEAGRGVSSELKSQLDRALADHAHSPSFDHVMSRIFNNVAKLVCKTGHNKEMAYAMADWFQVYAAENYIHPESLFNYIIALDGLQADMTGPLHTLLREESLRSADVQIIWKYLRPITRKKLTSLWNDHIRTVKPRRAIRAPGHGLIEAGDWSWGEIERRYREDPDPIIIRLGRRHRALRDDFDTDDDYWTDTDASSDDDGDYCPYAYGSPRVHDPSSFHPLPGPSHAPPRLCGPPRFMVQPGHCSPLPPMGAAHLGPLVARPAAPRRGYSYPIYPTYPI